VHADLSFCEGYCPAASTSVKETYLMGNDLCVWGKRAHDIRGHHGLALSHMVFSEQKLPIQVAGLDGVQVDLQGRRFDIELSTERFHEQA
jgi:hypothetical protein